MGKLTFIAGLAAGYVLGARAGRQRYEQIARTSGKVWNSGPVQKQVSTAKEVARTKAAPVVADMVADAARATGEKLRSSRPVGLRGHRHRRGRGRLRRGERPTGTIADRLRRRPLGRGHEEHRRRRLSPSAQAGRGRPPRPCAPTGPAPGTPATPSAGCRTGWCAGARRGSDPLGRGAQAAPSVPLSGLGRAGRRTRSAMVPVGRSPRPGVRGPAAADGLREPHGAVPIAASRRAGGGDHVGDRRGQPWCVRPPWRC